MRTTAIAIALSAVISSISYGWAAPVGRTDPPHFPDISGYTPVNPNDYIIQLPNPGRPYPVSATYFLTPDGVTCAFNSPPSAGCRGNNLPGIPAASPAPTADHGGRINGISTSAGLRQYGVPAGDSEPVAKLLAPFHSITVDGVICGVDDAGTTACRDGQGQGFVLSAHGSGWLPHV